LYSLLSTPTNAQQTHIVNIMQAFLHVMMYPHHLQRVLTLCLLKLQNY